MDKVMATLIGGTHDGKTVALSHKDQVLVYMPASLLPVANGGKRARNPDEIYTRVSSNEYLYSYTIHYDLT